MRKPRKPPDEDIDLFHETVGPVRRLESDRIVPKPPRPAAIPRQSQLDDQRVIDEMADSFHDYAELESGDELLYIRPGLQHNLVRKLRRGQLSIERQLDLHGMTVAVAKQALASFLRECEIRGYRCVRIVHGKGRGSRNRQPILKGKLGGWLQQRNEVLAYCSARPIDGGTGAIYVLLKRRG